MLVRGHVGEYVNVVDILDVFVLGFVYKCFVVLDWGAEYSETFFEIVGTNLCVK